MTKLMIIVAKFLTKQQIKQARIVHWRIAEVFSIEHHQDILAKQKSYKKFYGSNLNFCLARIGNSSEYSLSLPMIEMVSFKGKYPSIYILSFLAFIGNEAEFYYDQAKNISSIYVPRHICFKYVKATSAYWYDIEQHTISREFLYH